MSQKSPEKDSSSPTTNEHLDSAFSGSGNVYFVGDDSPKFPELLTEWITMLEAKYAIHIKSYHTSGGYHAPKYVAEAPTKKVGHPNEGGLDSFSVRAGT